MGREVRMDHEPMEVSTHDTEPTEKYAGIELKAEITNFCQKGNCKFCSPMFRPATAEAGTQNFLAGFKTNVDKYLSQGGRRIILTGGGEPLDAPAKLFGALEEINDQIKNKGIELELLTIYSNGVSIMEPAINYEGESQLVDSSKITNLDRLQQLGVTDINLSISGLTPEERTKITGEAMGSIDFDKLIPEITGRNIRVMTRSTLVRGGIDDIDHVAKFTEWMTKLGVSIVYFSDLFNVPKRGPETTPGNQNVLRWTDEHRIDFDALLEEVKGSVDFEFISETTRHEGQGTTYEFKYAPTGTKIIFGSLDIGNEQVGHDTYGYLKPDGTMSGTNNADDKTVRDFMGVESLKKYRPARDDWEEK